MSSSKKIKLLDTFAGVGGFRLALEKAIGKDNVECVGYSEIDKFAKAVYNYRFSDTPNLGDISKIDISNLQDFDILTWGFPCQDVSLAGQQNLDNGRTVLVEYLLKILEEKQPKYFLFENVKGLLSKKFNDFFDSILSRIDKAGYEVEYKVLNSKDFGLPQNRERVFLLWRNKRIKRKLIFPNPPKTQTKINNILQTPNKVSDKYTISNKAWKGHKKRKKKYKKKGYGFWYSLFDKNDKYTSTLTKRYHKDGSEILINQGAKQNPRKLTPIEAERLQWYPDDWTYVPYKHRMMSDTQRYKQMGNAISIPVVQSIFKTFFNTLK